MLGTRDDEKRSAAIRKIKEFARALLDARDDDVIVVTELACTEPGCPPVETVVALLRAGRPPWQVKLHKPAVDVSEGDLRAALRDRASDASAGTPLEREALHTKK